MKVKVTETQARILAVCSLCLRNVDPHTTKRKLEEGTLDIRFLLCPECARHRPEPIDGSMGDRLTEHYEEVARRGL